MLPRMRAELGHQDTDRTVFSDLHYLCAKGVLELQKNQNQPKAMGGDWHPLSVLGKSWLDATAFNEQIICKPVPGSTLLTYILTHNRKK